MRLHDLAHVRTGDKGDTSQISVIAYRADDYPRLAAGLTPDRVGAALNVAPASVRRYELPHLGALNFVLEGALRGGVTRSLALDPHGKTLGAQLLTLEIGEVP
ncbi:MULTISPECIES: AtuA-related protein [unclassified Sphingomonas]|uniref:AtuA-related protein n=1 Tax=unclassified Sphingomonas TaxID=196159 RepID=UPI0006F23859|nr:MULTISPECIES: hypothetical protein [unclassified Sphingomonas]KQN20796.1 hypothetical protein ASE89_15040 [Sphingomonas sp. Leaf30]MBD8550275.1 hypothetical protein [Sphingomonas sp. CFBP 8764]